MGEWPSSPTFDEGAIGSLISERVDPLIASVVEGDVANLHGAARHHLAQRGKRLRSALTLLAGAHLGANVDDCVALAAALELAHEASLVHDDIQDRDRRRRGQDAVWTRYGVEHAINVGDLLVVRSIGLLSRLAPARTSAMLAYFTDSLARLSVGQALDLTARTLEDVDEDKYFALARLKTVPLIEIALVGPGRLGDQSADVLESLGRYADALGLVFQITDDVLDVIGGKARDHGSDARAAARSYVVCLAQANATPVQRARLGEAMFGAGEEKRQQVILEIVDETRAVEKARRRAAEIAEGATRSAAVLPRGLADALGASLERVLRRDS